MNEDQFSLNSPVPDKVSGDARSSKVATGSFLTKKELWLIEPVLEFIKKFSFECVFDPFAGEGDMLNAVEKYFPHVRKEGFDLYNGNWKRNDSLISIPAPEDCFIATNPPYLAKYSARRKGVLERVSRYFEKSPFEDLYQLALLRLVESQHPFVAIVPESFLTSGIQLAGVERVVVLLDNPFEDTDVPVCVVCVNPSFTGGAEIFSGTRFLGSFKDLATKRISHKRTAKIDFNVATGRIGLRAVDSTDPKVRIGFMPAEEFSKSYGREKIKHSSRLLTYLEIRGELGTSVEEFCKEANSILEEIRESSCDVVLSAFKGNTRAGTRRRRLDYALARAILEKALLKFSPAQDLLI